MPKSLFFICPTDYLENVIGKTFKGKNYYYSSLGNSLRFESDLLKELQKLILAKGIQEIYFVLANDNRILNDAQGRQIYSKVSGLPSFYAQIMSQKVHTLELWQTKNPQFLILSYHLNQKIKELQFHLNAPLKISGKIYNRQANTFNDIYPTLINSDDLRLN